MSMICYKETNPYNTTKGMWPSDQVPRLGTPFHGQTPVTHLEIQQPIWTYVSSATFTGTIETHNV